MPFCIIGEQGAELRARAREGKCSVFSFQFSVFRGDRLEAGLQLRLFDNLVVREDNVPLRGWAMV